MLITSGFQTKQTNPETPSTALFAEPVSATSVSLSWTPLLATQWNGQPKGYLILYRIQGTDDWVSDKVTVVVFTSKNSERSEDLVASFG